MISTLNTAYDVQESRAWWKTRLIALALTVGLALFILVSFALIIAGPQLAGAVAESFGFGWAFVRAWTILQWPLVFALVVTGIGISYYYAPDARQEWVSMTPGAVFATVLWILISLGFKVYLANWGNYNATYGALAGVIILLLWFYLSGLAGILVGAELNAEIEHASPYGKAPGEKEPGGKEALGDQGLRESRADRSGPGGARGVCGSLRPRETKL